MITIAHGSEAAPFEVALRLASCDIVKQARSNLQTIGVVDAVACRDPAPLFDWMIGCFAMQGVSDRAAAAHQAAHGQIRWNDVQKALGGGCECPRLRSWWHFECGYRKTLRTCAEPALLEACDLPKLPARKGSLAAAAFGLELFIKDICNGDLVGWIDLRLAAVDHQSEPTVRGRKMALAVIEPLAEIPGVGPKVSSMLMAELLLGGDPNRERWITAGASMIAVDSLVHNFLSRTGLLREHSAEHPYGARCHDPSGCVGVIEELARKIDASAHFASLPRFSPRLLQTAIWSFCAEGSINICNGRNIDDRYGCRLIYCPAGPTCARLPLRN